MTQIIDYVNAQGKFETPNIMIEMAFWFNLSSYLSLINPKITYDNKEYKINFYGIPILSSGSGKAQMLTEPVLTPNGFVAIGSLKVGDYVIGSDGKPKKVIDIFEHKQKDVYKVETRDGKYTLCSGNHLWTVVNVEKKKITVETKELNNKFYIPTLNDGYKQIARIEKLNFKADMRCISIDSDDFLYVTRDFLLTHNSFSYKQTKKLLLNNKEHIWKEQLIRSYLEANNGEDETIIGEQKIKLINYLPNYENSIEGTREGIYLRALALSKTFCGSLNFVSEEIMDLVVESQIDTLKELYDGVYLGKVIKGAINDNIYGLRTNALLFGSSVGLKKDKNVYNKFAKALSSGIYRRSFIYYEEPKDIVKHNIKEVAEPNITHINSLLNLYVEDAVKGKFELELMLDKEAENMISDIGEELIVFANENKYDERYSAELGSLEKIIKLSALHTIYKDDLIVKRENVEYAYNFYKTCRDSVKGLFAIEPQHVRLYKILENSNKPLTKSEMIEIENATINKSQLKEDLLYMEEYAYRKGKKIDITGDKVKFYQLKDLEKNILNECIISIPKEDKGVKTNQYIDLTIPFFGSTNTVEKLVKSNKVSNFTLCHFIDGKRKATNVKDKINLIAFDIDDGLHLYDAKERLKDYTYIIYTTRNHQVEKNGIITDRFRIIVPLEKNIFLTNDRYKIFIKNIAKFLKIEPIDTAALDISRLWFTNPEANVYTNNGELLSPEPFMPETEVEEATNRQVNSLRDDERFIYKDDKELERRINGAMDKFLKTTYKGNRNINLFKYAMFFKDLIGSEKAKELTLLINSKLINPIDEKEIERTIFKSL